MRTSARPGGSSARRKDMIFFGIPPLGQVAPVNRRCFVDNSRQVLRAGWITRALGTYSGGTPKEVAFLPNLLSPPENRFSSNGPVFSKRAREIQMFAVAPNPS